MVGLLCGMALAVSGLQIPDLYTEERHLRISDWFAAHPKAAAAAKANTQSGMSRRALVTWLQKTHKYPFRDHTKLGDWLNQKGVAAAARTTKPPERFLVSEREVKALDKIQDFFVTCAVSNSPVCAPALRALEHAAAECGGKILINPVRYKNPTRRGEDSDETWDDAVRPYLLENEVRPHPLLSLMTTRVQATASNPLPPRIDGRTKARSAVFGHPQLSMRTVATPQNKLPKILYSSGAITERAYSDTLAGDMADFHHSIAAIKVEVRGNRFHLREITWDGRQFVDIDRAYTPKGVADAPRAEALVLGDVHVGLEDQEVLEATFGPGGMTQTLRPKRLVLHDLFDGRSVNPHERGNALLAAVRHGESVRDEIELVAEWLATYGTAEDGTEEVAIVDSNHDDFLGRWLSAGKFESRDARLYHWLMDRMLAAHEENGEFPNPLELALREFCDVGEHVRFLDTDESYSVHEVELGMHGHRGPDGARGSPQNLSRIGTKFICGHRHAACIWRGGYWVGVLAKLRHGYNTGPSSWIQSNAVLHANGKRQLLHIIGGHFRG